MFSSDLHRYLCAVFPLEDAVSSASAFIHKQKDHSVVKLSLVLHGCRYQLVKLRKPIQVTKTFSKELERPFWGEGWILFEWAQGHGILDICAVTWLDDDRHLKRWHSAGLMTAATQDEEVKCTQGLWSDDPPLSANTRWSTEPPWIL